MNHTELIAQISARTGVPTEECEKVIEAFEEVFSEGLAEKRWRSGAFDMAYGVMRSIKARKESAKSARDVNSGQ